MKLCYTAIIGNYDCLKDPLFITPGWEYVCFTDQDITSKVWQIKKIITAEGTASARKIKIMYPFSNGNNYKKSLWVDASILIRGDLNEFTVNASGFDGMALKHPHRKTISQEAIAVIGRKKDSLETVRNQMRKYRDEGFIQNSPLVATGILFRNNTDESQKFSALWIEEVLNHSLRDQLSFNYAQQKSGARFLISSLNIYDKNNKYFLLHKHL